ncbi:carbohydrate ABC transporter permease [Spirochaeta cellobiosiphila]|uniref:carbohydrate ABC transporter permease n=1 Tax=Spirochaeta cellobiosiphila TaxID=504483 RepID=UPI0003F9FB20|nr:carbohydrate ABC transporter permease [Spirochaeta cellobiosiphila]
MKSSIKGKLPLVPLGLLVLLMLFPLYWLISLSLRQSSDMAHAWSLLPHSFTLHHWEDLWKARDFIIPLGNSLFVGWISLMISMIAGTCGAYILGRSRFRHWVHRSFIAWILTARILPPITLGIPLFILFNKTHLLGTNIPLILSHSLMNLPFIMWFLIPAFRGIPQELEESAKIDGAGDRRIFIQIALPLIGPSLAAVAIFSFMNSWNEYAYAVVMTQSPGKFTLPLRLATFNSEQEVMKWGSLAAGGSMSLLPLLIFALVMQRYLVSGLTAGSVKS